MKRMKRNVIRPIGNGVSEVQLNSHYATIINDADVERVEPFKWSYSTSNRSRTGYARARVTHPRVATALHRLLLCFPIDWVDHINQDGLDNRRCNLRIVDVRWNNLNHPKRLGCTSRFVGVHRYKDRWCSQIRNNYFLHTIGFFDTEEEAARAWDEVAKVTRGKRARLNFPA